MANVEKITVTIPGDMLAAVRDLAGPRGVSAWLSDAARARLVDEGARAAGALFRSPDGAELLRGLRHASHARAAALTDTGV